MTEDGIAGVHEEVLEGEKLKVCTKCYLHPEGHADEHPWRAEVDVGEAHWATNALTFSTAEDAEAYAYDLMGRWTAVRDIRVVLATTPLREDIVR